MPTQEPPFEGSGIKHMTVKRKPRHKRKPELKPPYLDRQRLGIPQIKPFTRRYGP